MPAPLGHATLIAACEGVDVSCDVTSVDVNRGRTRLWDAMQAATASVQINVGHGAGQPHTRGPIGASMVIDVAYGSVRRHLFTGSVQLRQLESTPAGTILSLDCVDAFEYLARQNRVGAVTDSPVGGGETITDRIDRWLDLVAWSSPRALDTTSDTCPVLVIDGNVLTEIQNTAASDGGDFYIDGAGTATFKSFAWRNTVRAVAAVFSDQNTNDWVPYSAASLRDDLDEIQNRVSGVRRKPPTTGATDPLPRTASNSSSIATFGARGDSYHDLELETDDQVANRVAKVVQVAAQSSSRFDPVVIQPELMPQRSWPKVLGLGWGSLVVTNRRWSDGTVTALYGHVVGEHWRLDANDATVTFRVSGTGTWDAIGPPRLPELVYDPTTGKWCVRAGVPCPPCDVVALEGDVVVARWPPGTACYCETGGGVVAPDGATALGFDCDGTIVTQPITDPRLKAVLWFTVLDPGFELFEEIDHEAVNVGPAFESTTPSVIPGGEAVNANAVGGVIGAQVSDHLAAASLAGGWTIDFWYFQDGTSLPLETFDIVDLEVIVVRLTPDAGLTHTDLQVGVIGVDPAHPSDPAALHLTGPLLAIDPDSFHHYVIIWDQDALVLTVYVDGIVVV